nr:energy transducer TonB [Dyella sp. ASV24]
MAMFGVILTVSGCSNGPARPVIGSKAPAATPVPSYPSGFTPPQEDISRFVKPIYPGFDALFGIEGTAVVYTVIASDGHVINALLDRSSGRRELDDSAVVAVRQSFFIPARMNGNAVVSNARVPVNFNANYTKHGMWPSSHLNPRYALDTRAFPYPSVERAFEGLSAQTPGGNNTDGHLTTFKLSNRDGSAREEWAFTDLGTPEQMAIRFVFAGTAAAPEVMVSALCQEGPAVCAERTPRLLMGPSFARGVHQ